MTWNLRFDSQPDNKSVRESVESLPDPLEAPLFMGKRGEQPWSLRRIHVAQEIRGTGLTLAGFQEALKRQVDDLKELLGDDWQWVGVGRDDGKSEGEFNPIFWNTKHLHLVGHDTFWLSETPFTPSKFPGAGCYRLAEVARFRPVVHGHSVHNPDHDVFTLINTHLDDRSEPQRQLGASLILHRARFEAGAPGNKEGAVIVIGDFNSEQSGRDSGAYRVLTGALKPAPIPASFQEKYSVPFDQYPNFVMTDLRSATPRLDVSGFFRTFTGFNDPLGMRNGGRIDYILGGNNGGWVARRYRIDPTVADDGVLVSDHRPVLVDFDLEAPKLAL